MAKGLAFTLKKMGTQADHHPVPGGAEAGVAAPSRAAHPAPLRQRARALHRLRALRRRVSGRMHLRARRGERPRKTRSRPASATRSATRSTSCAASTAATALRRARPRRSRSVRASSWPTIAASGPSSPRPSCSSCGRASRRRSRPASPVGAGADQTGREELDPGVKPARRMGRAGAASSTHETAPLPGELGVPVDVPTVIEPARGRSRDDRPLRGRDRACGGERARRRVLAPDHLLGAEPRRHGGDAGGALPAPQRAVPLRGAADHLCGRGDGALRLHRRAAEPGRRGPAHAGPSRDHRRPRCRGRHRARVRRGTQRHHLQHATDSTRPPWARRATRTTRSAFRRTR